MGDGEKEFNGEGGNWAARGLILRVLVVRQQERASLNSPESEVAVIGVLRTH